jgi:hypothetical protein
MKCVMHNAYGLLILSPVAKILDRLCGLVVRISGYESKGSGSIPCALRFS